MKQVRLIERFNVFLENKSEKSINLAAYCNELVAVEYALASEKCLASFKIQQLLEAQTVKPKVKENRLRLVNILTSNLSSCWGSALSDFDKMAYAEEVFQCFNLLGMQPSFKEQLSENLLRQIAKATVGRDNLPDIVASLKSVICGSLAWLIDLSDLTSESTLQTEIREGLAEILLKGIFSKAEFFPVSNLEVYTENYQIYHQFCIELFARRGFPTSLKTHLKKKESLLYKSFVIAVIKKLEGSLIQLSKHIETCKTGGEIEEYCQRKSGKSLKAIIQDLILRNISKDTITTTLLHRVFAIGLRTIMRIKAFFENFYETLTDKAVLNYLARLNIELCQGLHDYIASNIDEIEAKLEIEEEQISQVKAAFTKRILELRDCGLCFAFYLQSKDQLKLDDEVAGIALKLNIQLKEPKHESIIINNVKNALSKFLDSDQFPEIDNGQKSRAVLGYISSLLEKLFDQQILDSIKTLEINKKFSSERESNEPKLHELISKQKQFDIDALFELQQVEGQ